MKRNFTIELTSKLDQFQVKLASARPTNLGGAPRDFDRRTTVKDNISIGFSFTNVRIAEGADLMCAPNQSHPTFSIPFHSDDIARSIVSFSFALNKLPIAIT